MDTFRRELVAAGIEYETDDGVLDFHSLRVSLNTLMARAGVPLAQRQALMRHKDPKLTATTYAKLELADAVGAVAKVDAPTVPNLYRPGSASALSGAVEGAAEPGAAPVESAALECASVQGGEGEVAPPFLLESEPP